MKHQVFFVALIFLVACQSDQTKTSANLDKYTQAEVTGEDNAKHSPIGNKSPELKSIVFVCARGIDKSVIAAHYFNEVVNEKRLHYKAISRASIKDKNSINHIPTGVLTQILSTGLTLRNTDVASLDQNIIDAAYKIIYLDNPTGVVSNDKKVEYWNDIPPIKAGVQKTTDIIKEKVDQFVKKIGC